MEIHIIVAAGMYQYHLRHVADSLILGQVNDSILQPIDTHYIIPLPVVQLYIHIQAIISLLQYARIFYFFLVANKLPTCLFPAHY